MFSLHNSLFSIFFQEHAIFIWYISRIRNKRLFRRIFFPFFDKKPLESDETTESKKKHISSVHRNISLKRGYNKVFRMLKFLLELTERNITEPNIHKSVYRLIYWSGVALLHTTDIFMKNVCKNIAKITQKRVSLFVYMILMARDTH